MPQIQQLVCFRQKEAVCILNRENQRDMKKMIWLA